jgi:26S proteasome regulatory subunit N2
MAYQIAFDLYESATQQFLSRVLQALRATAPIPTATSKTVKVPVNGIAKEGTTGESGSEVNEEEKKPERKMENLVSESKFDFASFCSVCFSAYFSFEKSVLKFSN